MICTVNALNMFLLKATLYDVTRFSEQRQNNYLPMNLESAESLRGQRSATILAAGSKVQGFKVQLLAAGSKNPYKVKRFKTQTLAAGFKTLLYTKTFFYLYIIVNFQKLC